MTDDLNRSMLKTMMNMSQHFAVQTAAQPISIFDEKNIPLKQFVQDIENGKGIIADEHEKAFVNSVITRLRGPAGTL